MCVKYFCFKQPIVIINKNFGSQLQKVRGDGKRDNIYKQMSKKNMEYFKKLTMIDDPAFENPSPSNGWRICAIPHVLPR